MRLAILHADSGATKSHTSLAGLTLVCINCKGLFVLNVLKKNARTAGDDNRGLLCRKLLHDRSFALLEVIGVYHSYAIYTKRAAKSLEIHLCGGIALDIKSCGGVLLSI